MLGADLEPFPVPVQPPDALHLATALFLAERRQEIVVAAYDERLRTGATALGLRLADL